MTARRVDLGASVAAVACAIVACAAAWVPLRAVAAAPLCLILPGYALTRAIFSRSAWNPQPTQAMRITLAVALSLTTLIIGSVALDLAPGGLRRTSWALLLTAVTVLASIVSSVRARPDSDITMALELPRVRTGSIVTLVLAAVIAVTAFVASRITWPAPNAIGYTQLWILPAARGQRAADIGVVCDQLHATGYRLVVSDGHKSRSWLITLRPGRARQLSVPVNKVRNGYVTATLYRDGHSAPYRQVRLAAGKV